MINETAGAGESVLRQVTVIGGGRVGRSLIGQLKAKYPRAGIRLVDIRAEDLVLRYRNTLADVDACQVDLGDDRALAASIQGDIVLNTAGPFYRHGTRAISAAIATGRNYVDVCDESLPLEAMRALTGAAAERGVMGVVGCGFSPGFPNMIVGNLVRRGLQIKDVEIAWCTSMADPVGQAAALHALHIARPPARHLSGGQLLEVQPLGNGRTVDFPEPFGARETLDVEHSEPVTLSASFGNLQSVWVGGTILPEAAMRRLRAYAELDLAGLKPLCIGDNDIARAAIVAALDREYWSKTPLGQTLPEAGAVVVSAVDQAGTQHRYALTGPMAQSTAAGAMAGMQALLRHRAAGRSGILFSEEAIDWTDYYSSVSTVGGTIHHHAKDRWIPVAAGERFPLVL